MTKKVPRASIHMQPYPDPKQQPITSYLQTTPAPPEVRQEQMSRLNNPQYQQSLIEGKLASAHKGSNDKQENKKRKADLNQSCTAVAFAGQRMTGNKMKNLALMLCLNIEAASPAIEALPGVRALCSTQDEAARGKEWGCRVKLPGQLSNLASSSSSPPSSPHTPPHSPAAAVSSSTSRSPPSLPSTPEQPEQPEQQEQPEQDPQQQQQQQQQDPDHYYPMEPEGESFPVCRLSIQPPRSPVVTAAECSKDYTTPGVFGDTGMWSMEPLEMDRVPGPQDIQDDTGQFLFASF